LNDTGSLFLEVLPLTLFPRPFKNPSHRKSSYSRFSALGRSKGGFTTKVHALVDALGLPLEFILTPGQSSEIKYAPELIKDIENANILGDKAFDCDEFINQIISQNCTPVIPPRSNRKLKREVDYHLYKERHLIECFFSKVKHFRRIFSRFDKMALAYLGFLAFASSIIWLR
jgi:transposase